MPPERVGRRYAIFAPGSFRTRSAKTAHGVIAYAADRTVAVIDPQSAGRRVRDVLPYLASDAPIVGSLDEARAYEPDALLIGVAPAGGALPPPWRTTIVAALEAGLDVVSGLHAMLGEDAAFAAAATRGGAAIVDVRTPPEPRLFSGDAYRVAASVVLTVGSDCAVGKMTASLELHRAARAAGRDARFLATGQTGILIAGGGVPVDRTICDFTSGSIEALVVAQGDAEVLFVEGQGGINNPAFAAVTLGLMFGAAPDALVLVHLCTRTHVEAVGTPLLSLRRLIATYEALCATVKPARVAGVALNTYGLGDAAARAAIAAARAETGLPCDDVVRYGPHAFYRAIEPALRVKTMALA